MDNNAIIYNITTFISTLFLLKFNADKFINHAALITQRIEIPDSIITLLIVGTE